MDRNSPTLQNEILVIKAKAFDLTTQLESSSSHIQQLEGVLRAIIEVTGFKELESKGLQGLVEYLTPKRVPDGNEHTSVIEPETDPSN